ncbi:Thiol-disulfide oxidoreductase ResA [Pseudobythopirellula maris]|uniref:Thiol-disulfide oxidoreductase ResA n=2 Tax=Pseudobythopirellula maris TaxID=2527991 RepID=A0A5C5ZIZ5_9BACT|nr:Thiol-disulfide oxidoreductase ResA [Pseudobythopirellula maris]
MHLQTYIVASYCLLVVFSCLLLAAVALLGTAAFEWKTPLRNRRLKTSCGLFLAALVVLALPRVLFAFVEFSQGMTKEMYEKNRTEMDSRASETSHVGLGEFAPDFSIEVDDGTSFTLSGHRGSVVLVNFFRTDCGPCNLEFPVLQEIWEKHGSRDDFGMIAISRGETMEAVTSFKSANKLTLPTAVDDNSSIYDQYAPAHIPRTYLVSRDGTIGFQTMGFMSDYKYDGDSEQLRTTVANALAKGQ